MSALDDLLNNEPGAWERGAFDADELVARCCSWLAQLPRLDGMNKRATRALWLVDRLCGKTCPQTIADLDQPALSATIHYIRARRDPSMILTSDPKYPDTSRACDAWVAAHTPGPELLRWYDLGERVVASGSFLGEHATLPVEEYGRCGAETAALMPLIESPTSVVAIAAATHIARRVATDLSSKPRLGDDLLPLLRRGGATSFAELIEAHIPTNIWPALSDEMFLLRAGADDLTDVARLVEGATADAALSRLVDLVQDDCPEVWEAALHVGSFTDAALRLFCQWVSPERSELLLPYIGHNDERVAGVAFHAYLYRASPAAVQDLVDASPHRWMASAWDRFRFAPAAVRPPEQLAEPQSAENDMRLHDAFVR